MKARKPPSPPPLSLNVAPNWTCSRALTWPNEPGDPICEKEPFLHCLWDPDTMENGLVCTEHARELDEKGWIPYQAHEVGEACIPGAIWSFERNVCYFPDEPTEEETVAAEHLSTKAPA